ncbi:jg6864 [Pararge aegeria aegeria]|uniref:Jg6864 protein n=1 Tax=Pararge aegeria aegeria TaxID=348720 RepID=A0A8S4RQS3_9NEOP|nr:jg6864 [Pararge aegeria aegeria]
MNAKLSRESDERRKIGAATSVCVVRLRRLDTGLRSARWPVVRLASRTVSHAEVGESYHHLSHTVLTARSPKLQFGNLIIYIVDWARIRGNKFSSKPQMGLLA